MPELTFGVIIFSSVFALAYAGAAVWLLGRKARASRRLSAHFPHAFLAGSVTFSLVYILNRLALPAHPRMTAVSNLALLAAVFLFRIFKKRFRRARVKIVKAHPRQSEAAALERMFTLDPLNTFCLEKLSEIYEEMGEYEKALTAANGAAKLDPTVENKCRVEELQRYFRERKRHRSGWK